jgi:hypothetical protein
MQQTVFAFVFVDKQLPLLARDGADTYEEGHPESEQ